MDWWRIRPCALVVQGNKRRVPISEAERRSDAGLQPRRVRFTAYLWSYIYLHGCLVIQGVFTLAVFSRISAVLSSYNGRRLRLAVSLVISNVNVPAWLLTDSVVNKLVAYGV